MFYPSESSEQSLFISIVRMRFPDYVLFSVANGGFRNLIEAKKLKDEGLLKGVSDLILLMPNGKSLFIEFKKQVGGTISKDQKQFFKSLDRLGFDYFVAYGCRDGLEKLESYLSN